MYPVRAPPNPPETEPWAPQTEGCEGTFHTNVCVVLCRRRPTGSRNDLSVVRIRLWHCPSEVASGAATSAVGDEIASVEESITNCYIARAHDTLSTHGPLVIWIPSAMVVTVAVVTERFKIKDCRLATPT